MLGIYSGEINAEVLGLRPDKLRIYKLFYTASTFEDFSCATQPGLWMIFDL